MPLARKVMDKSRCNTDWNFAWNFAAAKTLLLVWSAKPGAEYLPFILTWLSNMNAYKAMIALRRRQQLLLEINERERERESEEEAKWENEQTLGEELEAMV